MTTKWRKAKDWAEEMGLSPDIVNVAVYESKKRYGKMPEYAKTENGVTYVNAEMVRRRKRLDEMIDIYTTSPDRGIYWLLREMLPTDMALARKLAVRSRIFKSVSSWSMFLSSQAWMQFDGFALPKMDRKPTMKSEFVKHGSRLAYDLRKIGELK